MAVPRGSLLAAAAVMAAALAAAGLPKFTPSYATVAPDGDAQSMRALRSQVALLSEQYRELTERQEALSAGFADADSRIALTSDRPEPLEASLDAQPSVEGLGKSAGSLTVETRDRRESLREDVLRPIFQIVGDEAVGSGVLIHRGHDEDGDYYLALSCYHVLRDILAESEDAVPEEYLFTLCFDQIGDGEVFAEARMLRQEASNDLALLRIDTGRNLGPVAQIAPLERASDVRPFTPVYTVGCPLGTGAQATLGEVTREDWVVDEQPYWMVSSPAYFGNSGGGVFLADTHELVGIFSKIYTHGSYRPQVVTHMGLAVPLPTLHGWLQEIGYGVLLPASGE